MHVINPQDLARHYQSAVKERVAAFKVPLTLVGFLSTDAGPSRTYADYTKIGCEAVGIRFDIRHVNKLHLEDAIEAANADRGVHGIIIYYPIFATERDRYIKDAVDHRKDIEGLSTYWVRKLYRNQRYDGDQARKAILPCTPLAVIKLLEAADAARANEPMPLQGRTITVFNRSEVVGRPLASMLANDGAHVYSFDVDGPLLFLKDQVAETDASRATALAQSDIVITGVPSRDFPLVMAHELKPGAVCVNFSTMKNFADDIDKRASVFIPRVGPMTIAMALRNTVRLYENYHV